jgi:hypothetical protein
MESLKKRQYKFAFSIVVLAIFAFLIITYSRGNYPLGVEKGPKYVENLSIENYNNPDGLKEFINLPENITNMTSVSWWKDGTTIIGNKTYRTRGSEIRLVSYEFEGKNSASKDYVLFLQKIANLTLENEYGLRGILIEHYSFLSEMPFPKYIDVFQRERFIYVLSYGAESSNEAETVLNSVI